MKRSNFGIRLLSSAGLIMVACVVVLCFNFSPSKQPNSGVARPQASAVPSASTRSDLMDQFFEKHERKLHDLYASRAAKDPLFRDTLLRTTRADIWSLTDLSETEKVSLWNRVRKAQKAAEGTRGGLVK